MHNGVELKLACTKYLKKILACITQEFNTKISKTKISRAHMKHNILRAFIPKKSKAIHKKKISRSHMSKISQACNVLENICTKNYNGKN
jgi:hypothetical protein